MFYKPNVSFGEAMIRKGLLRLSRILPGNLALGLAAVIPVVAMYALVEWQFRQSELTGKMQPVRSWG